MRRTSSQIRSLIFAVSGIVVIVGAAALVSAADLYVDTTSDLHYGNCILQCSLRDAILVSNTNGQDDTIHVPAGHYSLTITGAGEDAGLTGDLDIDSPDTVTIIGEGPGVTTIDGNAVDRVFHINQFGTGNVVLQGMTITGGNPAGGSGGGVFNWDASLWINNCEITGNHVTDPARQGGGVFNEEGFLYMRDTVVSNNSSDGEAGGLYLGPGSSNTIVRSTIDHNQAASVGGVLTEGVSNFYNVTIYYNTADDNIEGIRNTRTATLRHCTLVQGSAATDIAISCNDLMDEVILQNTMVWGTCDAYETNIDAQKGNIEYGDTCYMEYGNFPAVGAVGLGLYGFGYNGGAVPTMKLYDSSMGNDNQWTTTYLLDHDARFVSRPVGTYGDSGAYELVPGEIFSHGFENGYATGWSSTVQ